MIRISIFYPHTPGAKFDMKYYTEKHLPMVKQRLSPACKSYGVDVGLGGGAPGSPPTYGTIGYLYFDSVEAFGQAFGPHAAEIQGDVANYTTIQPIVQISEVKI